MLRSIFILLFSFPLILQNIRGQDQLKPDYNVWLHKLLNIPAKPYNAEKKQVVIAIIDDGFRFTHKELKPFIYNNPDEIPGNFIDDDNNGYIDDFNGWDVSDNDNDATYPAGREQEYFHGTAVAGIITGIINRVYGPAASEFVKILPVKALSSQSGNSAILDGYKGIKYALGFNPGIICCAWGGGTPTEEEKAIVEEACKKGIIVIASAGNLFSEKDEYPSMLPGVWDIAAIDTLNRKMHQSNYSMRVDFAVPGVNIKAPYPIADNSYFIPDGTSVSAAVMTGCAGLLKLSFPVETKETIEEAIKNTAMPVDSINIRYCGKMGAGIPDIQKAMDYISQPGRRFSFYNPLQTKGTLIFNPHLKRQKVEISPPGAYSGIFLHFKGNYLPRLKGSLKIFNKDTIIIIPSISQLPQNLFVPGSGYNIELISPYKTADNLKIQYYFKTIDSTKLYCDDIKYFGDLKGEFSDGSGTNNYANYCSCKWIIRAPEGEKLRFEFTEFDTQAKTDFVWLFDGENTIPENIIARFSGPVIPPIVKSASNKVLIWFVSDGYVTGKGWKLRYTTED
jgi:serine protease